MEIPEFRINPESFHKCIDLVTMAKTILHRCAVSFEYLLLPYKKNERQCRLRLNFCLQVH